MKRLIAAVCVLTFSATGLAQESDVTYEETTATTEGVDLLTRFWQMEDTTPVGDGVVELRLSAGWLTASAPANRGDSNDDFVVTPSIVWGCSSDVELWAEVPVWVGDQGDMPGHGNGNADTNLGLLWRIVDQEGYSPAVALGGAIRAPTGDRSNGVDGELRLVLSNEYDSGLRSHVNAFAESVNGDNLEDARHFQWGVVVGMDGPLCADGAVRWVADYMFRSAEREHVSNINMLELGWEWDMAEGHKLAMSFQVGLDHNDDTPNFGAGVIYALSLGG
ncbi:MAG: hypothetical protein ACYTFA_13975 [Planctomycetota bacterium]|jgi:hypothetical protein